MKRRDLFKSLLALPTVIFKPDSSGNRPIGLDDRNGRAIFENDKLCCKTGNEGDSNTKEIVGVVRWAKYIAGFSLQDSCGDRTIGTFRFRVLGPLKIREMNDGRIDGVVL